ncbi:MAG: hypothetical protein P8I94_08795, partial [Emcibacteraceae bacterium]|nr:hypothetical protein [Emcibacteraceae bacterium]
LKLALSQFSARKGVKFKVENIIEFNLISKNPISVSMKVFDSVVNKTGTMKFSNPEIAAAMMGYCMYLKIPLPKSGKKSLQVKENEFYLNIKVQ